MSEKIKLINIETGREVEVSKVTFRTIDPISENGNLSIWRGWDCHNSPYKRICSKETCILFNKKLRVCPFDYCIDDYHLVFIDNIEINK